MNKERAKEILIKYKENKALFNWCDEYEQFINNNICCLVNEEAEFMLKMSLENNDSPLSYDDLDLNDYDALRESLIYEIEDNYKEKDEQEDLREQINLISISRLDYLDIKEDESFKDFINNLNEDDLILLNDEIGNDDIPQNEIFQWFIVNGDIARDIKENDGIILNENWFGRCCYGQSLSMDYMFIIIYINRLKRWFTEEELKQIGY